MSETMYRAFRHLVVATLLNTIGIACLALVLLLGDIR